MRVIICCNHTYPHCGGSEKVVKQITDASVGFGHDVTVVSRSIAKPFVAGGAKYIPCARDGKAFLEQIKSLKPDHTHVYSDSFVYWPNLLHRCDSIPGKKSIALVGMNYMLRNPSDLQRMRDKADQIRAIVHSDYYQDYQVCTNENIPVSVIPNGIMLPEFDLNTSQKPFARTDKKLILCVSNFFPFKGQDHLVEVLKRLYDKRQDWYVAFFSTTVNFTVAQLLSDRVRKMLSSCPFESQFLVDQPRELTISAFRDASVFAFPSQKEVAPLVALEAQAARCPWVALPVGNVPALKGGRMAVPGVKDAHGNFKYSQQTYDTFADHLNLILGDSDLASRLGEDGRRQVEETFDWSIIAEQYNRVFWGYHEDE